MSPATIESLDAQKSTLTLSLDSGLYPDDAMYAAAYVFLDRAYVLLDRAGSRSLIHLRGKAPLTEETLRALAGEFANELLAQVLRLRVVKANQKIIEEVTALAISGAAGRAPREDESAPLIDLENAGDDGFLDDPLGLGAPWEPGKKPN